MSVPPSRLIAALADRYRLERELSAGGMATVYLARDLKHERDVALKVMRPELAAVIGAERFLSEIRTTANLQHPHILPLHDSGSVDGTVFYVMPFIAGESLRDRLDREQQLPVADAVRIASQVASALDYAHRQGVIHRDIKPENILLHDGSALVADFGIALAASQTDGGSRLTETGMSLGTPTYMSPEQAMGERTLDARTDIYALGCVLYEALAGEPPFTGPTAQAIVARVMTEGPRPLSSQRGTVPANVNAAVSMALAKLPADRFPTAAAFAAALADPAFRLAVDEIAQQPAAPYWNTGRLAALAAGITIVLAGGVLLGRGTAPATASNGLRVQSVILPPKGEDFATRRSFGALSPDGQRFAFVSISAVGERHLWIRPLNALEAERLDGTNGARAPFWSPDGTSLAFLTDTRLQRLDLATGTVTTLCETSSGQAGAWGPEDLIVVATARGIERMNTVGAPCEVVIASGESEQFQSPSLTDDGRTVLFDRRVSRAFSSAATISNLGTVVIGDLGTGAVTELAPGAWTPTFVAPNLVLFGTPTPDREGLHLVARSLSRDRTQLEGEPVTLSGKVRTAAVQLSYSATASGTLIYLPSSGDPEKLLVDRRGLVQDTVRQRTAWTHRAAREHRWVALASTFALWLYDLDRNTSTPLTANAPEGFALPVWAPGDTALAFGRCQYARIDDLPEGISRVSDKRCEFATDWAADGRSLIVQLRTPGSPTGTIAVWDLADSTSTPLFDFTGINAEAVVSPDGGRIAYVSAETGVPELFVRPFRSGGRAVRLTTGGARSPRWRRDGREFFYQTADGRLMAMAVPASGELTAAVAAPLFRAPTYQRDMFLDQGTNYDVTSDGQQFVVRLPASDNHAVLVQHWLSMLGAK